jgi:hypothetical protein
MHDLPDTLDEGDGRGSGRHLERAGLVVLDRRDIGDSSRLF